MEYIKLGEICDIKTGKLDANASSLNGQYPFFTCSKEPLKIDSYSYDCECVLIAGNGDLNVKYYSGKFDAYQRTYIVEVKDKEKYKTKYIYLLLESKLDDLRNKSIGGVIKYIKLGDLTSIEVPLISITDQEKIIAQSFKLNETIRLKENQIKLLDDLIKSQFIEMFGDPFINPNKYEFYPFVEYMDRCVDIGSNGANQVVVEHLDMKDEEDYALLIRTLNFTSNDFKNNVKYISKEAYEFFSKSKVYGGEIIFNKIGSAGINFLMPYLNRPVSLGLNQIMITPKNINTRYLYDYLNTEFGKLDINSRVNGAVTKSIQKTELKKIPIMYPPIELQEKYAKIAEQIDKQKNECKESLKKLEEMQSALMQEYFG